MMTFADEFAQEAQRLLPQQDSSLTIGLVLGLLVGAIAAIFLVPQSGAQTRTMLREQSVVLRKRAGTLLDRSPSRFEPPL
jgi:predicted RNA polymerase sigma factor